ncbi:MAG: 50S ribosomal protein L15 [candidate division Zixibacteria bacterium]
MDLANLKPAAGSTRNRKRLGRGTGSGTGKTSGKGHKGQKSRSGYKSRAWSEGGQMPLQRRLPKRGFTNIFRVDYQDVNISALVTLTDMEITPETLHKRGFAPKKNKPIKILGMGEIEKTINISAHAFSKTAREKIEKAGGTVVVIGGDKKKKPANRSSQAEDKS